MDVTGDPGEVSDGNQKHVLKTGGKVIHVIKWQETG